MLSAILRLIFITKLIRSLLNSQLFCSSSEFFFCHLNFQTRVENALAATIEPLHINRECQGLRQQRVATDDCDDPVDRDLAKEIGVIQSSADLLKAEGFLK